MYDWNIIYKRTLKNICEANANEFENIVEVEQPKYKSELVENENTDFNSLYRYKLDDDASDDDKRKFVEYIYNYTGEDVYDFLPSNDDGGIDMNEDKIRKLLKTYGAEDIEIENFMKDLAEAKDDLEEDVADDDYVLNAETISKLKETDAGVDLLIKAPEMAKEELKKAIAEYLQSNK